MIIAGPSGYSLWEFVAGGGVYQGGTIFANFHLDMSAFLRLN